MAKLNNVKVLDMVGGEITRIAYDGAEYTKVDGDVAVNDILMPINDGWDTIGNAFYKIVDVNDRENPKIYDDKGDRQVILYNGAEKSLIFRKTLATTPPIEERVSALESRVDAIESGKATEDEPLKVGDYAKVLIGNGFANVGDIVKIAEDDGTNIPFRIELLNGEYAGYKRNNADNLVRATDEEVTQAKAELKRKQITVGTYVKLAIKDGERPRFDWGNVQNGAIGKVTSIDGYGDIELSIDFDAQKGWNALFSEVEIVTAEEYEKYQAELDEKHAKEAEQKKWAEIGREVGEFKVGDVVKVTGKGAAGLAIGHIDVVSLVDSDGDVYFTNSRKFYLNKNITLVTPFEQRFDLTEVDA